MDTSAFSMESVDQQRIDDARPRKTDRGETYYSSCRVPMVYAQGTGSLSLTTGELSSFVYRNMIGVCGSPLFSRGDENKTGVCVYCARHGAIPEKVYHRPDGESLREVSPEEVAALLAVEPWTGDA